MEGKLTQLKEKKKRKDLSRKQAGGKKKDKEESVTKKERDNEKKMWEKRENSRLFHGQWNRRSLVSLNKWQLSNRFSRQQKIK